MTSSAQLHTPSAPLHSSYLSLGSNIGDRHSTLWEAIRLIGQAAGRVERVSSFIETEPWGFSSEHRFIKCCIRIATPLTPHQLLRATQAIEIQLGRTAKSVDGQYHDRPIDIDILTYDDLHIDAPDLHIPHPHMHERDFVMQPLSEIM